METPELSKSTLFFSDQHLCYADALPPSQVKARIEVAVLNFLKNLCSPSPVVADLPLVSRTTSNCKFRQGLMSQVSSIFLSHSFCMRSLIKSNDAKAFIRVWKVMEVCFQIMSQEKIVTQRELFYKLLCDSPDYFKSQSQVNKTVQDVVALLRCSRYSLGIIASSRGTIIGRILLKDAIFQRLAEDRIFNHIPSILITSKGYPDLATRFLLYRLSQHFPELPILALVDWNPSGLAILCIYKFGSISMGLEAYKYACNVKWVGLRKSDVNMIPSHSFAPLNPRDQQTAKSLMSSEMLPENHREELTCMVEKGMKVDIEALYVHGFDFLGKYICKKIVEADYI